MPTPAVRLTYVQRMIKKATGAPDKRLPALEFIMRNEVFHSTLDWLTWDEFREGAYRALGLYARDARAYDAELAFNGAVFQLMQAAHAVRSAEESGDRDELKKARSALYRARRKETKTREHLAACLGTALPPTEVSEAHAVSYSETVRQ